MPVRLKDFSFKLAMPKVNKESKSKKAISTMLYCLSVQDENGVWKAKVNTKYLENYPDFIICNFTEKSHSLKGKTNLFYTKKDKHGHWVRRILTEVEALVFEGSPLTYSPFCVNNIYCGYLMKVNGELQFDMVTYVGTKKYYSNLLET